TQARAQDVGVIDHARTDDRPRKRPSLREDPGEQLDARVGVEFLAVVEPVPLPAWSEHHGGRDHRSGERTAARFVDSRRHRLTDETRLRAGESSPDGRLHVAAAAVTFFSALLDLPALDFGDF